MKKILRAAFAAFSGTAAGRTSIGVADPRTRQREALASLIINQASFAVLDALADALADLAREHAPDVVVAMPTLGLALAEETARRLGHSRYVPLSTSRKFWYDDALSVPLHSDHQSQPGKAALHGSAHAAAAGRPVDLSHR